MKKTIPEYGCGAHKINIAKIGIIAAALTGILAIVSSAWALGASLVILFALGSLMLTYDMPTDRKSAMRALAAPLALTIILALLIAGGIELGDYIGGQIEGLLILAAVGIILDKLILHKSKPNPASDKKLKPQKN